MAILARCPTCHKKQKVSNKICDCGESLDKAKRAKRVRYYVAYRLPGGKQQWEPVGFSLEEARTAEGKRKVQKYENPRILQKVPEEKMTFQQLTDWYLALEMVRSRAYYPTLKINLASFNREFGNVIVSQLRPMDLENYQVKRKREGKADAYVDREIGAARTMVNKAFDNDMVSGETVKVFRRVKKLLKRNGNARDRVLSPEEFDAICRHAPRLTRDIITIAYYTGMRKEEILPLSWDKVDLQARMIRLEAPDTKDREKREIPICEPLYQTLKAIPRALHDGHVFQYKGKSVDDIRAGLKKACEDAGIAYGRFVKGGFILHDLRHTFNTNMRKAGVPESVIMAITGHSTREMFDRYNTIDHDDKQRAVDQMRSFLQSVRQNVDEGGLEA